MHIVYEQMGNIFGYTGDSLKNVVSYSNSIEQILKFLPDTAADILNGKIKLSAPDTIALAKMDFSEIHTVIERLENEKTLARTIINEQKALRKKTNRLGRPKQVRDENQRISVKDIPLYNPDAQINALAYTIPSWISIVERTAKSSVISETSSRARGKLLEELAKLTVIIEKMNLFLVEG
jgi:hypothetical protein